MTRTEHPSNAIPPCDAFMERFFKIRTKQGTLIPFHLNEAQRRLYAVIKENFGKRPVRIVVLKSRQMGISTVTEGIITYNTMMSRNTDSIIIAHDSSASASIYNMTKLFVSEMPDQLRPKQKLNNARVLSFESDDGKGLKSSVRVGVANDSTRGQTYRFAHLSEVAFWDHPEEAMLSVMQCVPYDPKTLVVVESTANGFNYFYDLWSKAESGENDFIPVFFPWYIEPTYTRPYTGFELTDYEKEIKVKFSLTDDQLEWRRWVIANNCNGDEKMFRQEYPCTPEEAFIVSGSSVFNNDIVLSRLKTINTPRDRGRFAYDYDGINITNIRWVSDQNGCISIYTPPLFEYDENGKILLPKEVQTVIGGDTAGDGEDYFAAHVLSKDGTQLAVLHQKTDEDLFSKQVYCLGRYYGSLIGIEVNFSTFPNMELQRLKYPWIYVREKFDRILSDVENRFGFRTTSLTRPIIIANLVEIVREHTEKIVDRETLQEMLSFVNLNGKAQASEGTHDDLVMSLAIAYEVLKQMPTKRKPERRNTEMDAFISFGT